MDSQQLGCLSSEDEGHLNFTSNRILKPRVYHSFRTRCTRQLPYKGESVRVRTRSPNEYDF